MVKSFTWEYDVSLYSCACACMFACFCDCMSLRTSDTGHVLSSCHSMLWFPEDGLQVVTLVEVYVRHRELDT